MNINRALTILIILLLIALTFKTINTTEHNFKEIEYTVAYGETLWSIAEDYCPEDMDIREYIDKLHISPNIYEGQTITILEEVK
jgi:hypothetical protein